MPEKTTYATGEPVWADLTSPDPAASRAFYAALLGWDCTEASADHGGYANFHLGGKLVAGIVPAMGDGQPPTWTVYLATDDSDATHERITGAGGTAVVAPMDVMDLGRMAVYADASGAVFGTWQAGVHTGSQLVGEAGAPAWAELTAAEPTDAPAFYGAAFGLGANVVDSYVELTADGGRGVAGVTGTAQGTSGWMPYFGVVDPAASAEQAVALGGTVVLPLTTWPGGSCTIVQDPHGAVLGLITT